MEGETRTQNNQPTFLLPATELFEESNYWRDSGGLMAIIKKGRQSCQGSVRECHGHKLPIELWMLVLRTGCCPPCPASTSPLKHQTSWNAPCYHRFSTCHSQVAPVKSVFAMRARRQKQCGAVRLSSKLRQHPTLKEEAAFSTFVPLWQNTSLDQLGGEEGGEIEIRT